MFKLFAAAALLATAGSASAGAPLGTLATLYSTGVDATGAATTGNGADLHWTVDGHASYTGATNGVFPIGPWLSETATSRWVTPTPSATDPYDFVDNTYTFTETFFVSAAQAPFARFTGRFSSDNTVDSIKLNGVTIPGSGGSFTSYQPFGSAGAAFVAGANTLTFAVRNFGSANENPIGLRVEVAGAVPEASTWVMMLAGFGLVGFATRRRTATVAA